MQKSATQGCQIELQKPGQKYSTQFREELAGQNKASQVKTTRLKESACRQAGMAATYSSACGGCNTIVRQLAD